MKIVLSESFNMGSRFLSAFIAAFHLIISFNGFLIFLIMGLTITFDVPLVIEGKPYSLFRVLDTLSRDVNANPDGFNVITRLVMRPGTYIIQIIIWSATGIFFIRLFMNSFLLKGATAKNGGGWLKAWLWDHLMEELLINSPIKVAACIFFGDDIHSAIKIVPVVLSYMVEFLCLFIVYSTLKDMSAGKMKVAPEPEKILEPVQRVTHNCNWGSGCSHGQQPQHPQQGRGELTEGSKLTIGGEEFVVRKVNRNAQVV